MDPRRGMVGWSWSPECFTLLLNPTSEGGKKSTSYVLCMYVNQVNQQSSIGQESFLSTEEIEDVSRERERETLGSDVYLHFIGTMVRGDYRLVGSPLFPIIP